MLSLSDENCSFIGPGLCGDREVERSGRKERKGKEWGKTLLNLILPLDLIAWKKGEKSAV
jgi:hypothetical protein